MAVSADGDRWFLLNCSPEIRQQIESYPPLHPRGPRHSPITAILLTNGDLDHCLGLLSLRESHPLVIYTTDRIRRGFTDGNVLYRTLDRFPGQVTWRSLELGNEEELADLDGRRVRPPGRGAGGAGQAADPPRGRRHAGPRGQHRVPDPRALDRADPGLSVRGRRGDRHGPPRARGRRLRVLRRDLLVGRRASRARARHQARRGHGPCADRRSGREPRPPERAERRSAGSSST